MKKISLVSFILILVFLMSGCSPFFIKKNQLIVVNNDSQGNAAGTITARVKVEKYEKLFNGTILAYNELTTTAVLANMIKKTDNTYSSELSISKNSAVTPVFNVSATHTEAKIDRKTNDIYFKEKDIAENKSALYWADADGDKKVRLTEDAYEKYLAWNLTKDGLLIYVNNNNEVILGNQNEQVSVYSLPKEYIVKKIAYASDENFILILAATSQTDNILYRLNLSGQKTLSSIDVNVSDFVVSEAKQITAYIKTTSGGQEQLYIYKHVNFLREYICSNNIEKLSFSPEGNFIAFATKITADIPTQSIWIIKYNNDIPIQLTANTKLSGNIYWTGDEKGVLFTTIDVSADKTDTEPIYTTYLMKFTFEYFNNESGGTEEQTIE